MVGYLVEMFMRDVSWVGEPKEAIVDAEFSLPGSPLGRFARMRQGARLNRIAGRGERDRKRVSLLQY